MLAFLPYDSKTQTFSFVIASEETRFRHLYLVHYPLSLEGNSPTRPKYSEGKICTLFEKNLLC